jgi:hypothetical protein
MKALKRMRASTLLIPLSVALALAPSLLGCGGQGSTNPPGDISGLKTPDDILKEAQAKDAAKAAPK